MKTFSSSYFKIDPKKIVEDILKKSKIRKTKILGIEYLILPNVYPSEKFRTTDFLLSSLPDCSNKTVCDMGCGMGIVGIHAMINKNAQRAVFVDINENAILNVRKNLALNSISEKKFSIYLSNAFSSVNAEIFDLIIFNVPFHNDDVEISNPLQKAFFDPNFKGVSLFLSQAKKFMNEKSQIIIAFSDKGDVEALENLFDKFEFKWKLWKRKNQEDNYDNRLYLLEN